MGVLGKRCGEGGGEGGLNKQNYGKIIEISQSVSNVVLGTILLKLTRILCVFCDTDTSHSLNLAQQRC